MNYVTLINKENPLKKKILDNVSLKETKSIYNKNVFVEEKTYDAFLELKKYLKKEITIDIDNSFRTGADQQGIWDNYLDIFGEEYTSLYVAPKGCSEHESGLAIDVSIKVDGEYLLTNDEMIANDKLYMKMHRVLAKFGFILRYPKGKESITGYNYEPWHIRYVGVVPATIMMENKITLEEYLTSFSGVLVVNKPQGITSFDVIRKVTKILGIKKIGHTGTLDPIASGVLVLTINKATKIGELLVSTDKEYIATVKMGIETDSFDMDGNILNKCDIPNNLDIESVLKSFKKTYLQEVPKYSAVKVGGKKLYEYARNNIDVELPKKNVTIYDIKLEERENGSFKFKTLVSKGTYIRSLIRDIGVELNTYCTMSDLIRSKQGKFDIKNSYSLEDIENNNFKILDITKVLDYPIVKLNDSLYKKISNGVVIEDVYNVDDKIIFIDKNNKIVAIYEKDGINLKSWKNFN